MGQGPPFTMMVPARPEEIAEIVPTSTPDTKLVQKGGFLQASTANER